MVGSKKRAGLLAVAALVGVTTVTLNSASATPTCFGREATIVSNAGSINGTPAADVIVGGSGINNVNGKGGNDRICSRGNEESIRGGQGNDMLDGGAGNDSIDGGDGTDRIAFASESSVVIDLVDGLAFNSADDTVSDIENVTGTDGGDIIKGDGGKNGLDGGRSQDEVRGRGGRDRISGGYGRDHLFGNRGDDRLTGGPHFDRADGGAGTDTCRENESESGCE